MLTISVAVILAAVCASIGGALSRPLWGDEVASARILSEPTMDSVLGQVRRTESTPPAWYVLAWTATRIDERLTGGAVLGSVERARLLSVMFAALAALLTALWALRLLDNRLVAMLAGALVALGSAPAAHAEQLRAYALLTLVSVAFGLLLVRVAWRKGAWSWAGLATLVALGALTHYFFFFTILAGVVWLWVLRPVPSNRRGATQAIAAGAIAFLPWSLRFVDQVQHRRYGWIAEFDARAVAELPAALFFHPEGLLYGSARITSTVCLVIGAALLWKTSEGRAVVTLCFLPIAVAAATWAAGQPIFNERNLLGVAPYAAIVAASAFTRLPRRLVAPATVSALLVTVTAAILTGATYGRVDYERVAASLVDMGWRDTDPVTVAVPTGETSLRIAVSWYLPARPRLAYARASGKDCSRFFAIGHSTTLGPWLTRHRERVEGIRRFTSYDHPVAGKANGFILVVRLHGAVDSPGDVFAARGARARCVT